MTRGHLLTMIRIYGLRNCDTCRRAIKDLERARVIYEFCDFRRDGLNLAKINEWQSLLGYDLLLNRKGTTWRGLSEDDKADLTREKAVNLMFNKPALIKRPVFEIGKRIIIGYKNEQKKTLGL